jgi:hypothetical protein
MLRTIICPRCGEWMDETHPDFPRCVFCGEKLTQCGFCRAFPGNGKPCPKAKGHPIVYASSDLNCPHFIPKFLARQTHPILSPAVRWQMAASLMFTLSVLIVAFLSRPVPSRVLLAASAPSQVVVGDSLEVRMLVKATANQPVRLRLDRRLLADFQLIGISPLPVKVEQRSQFLRVRLACLSRPSTCYCQVQKHARRRIRHEGNGCDCAEKSGRVASESESRETNRAAQTT